MKLNAIKLSQELIKIPSYSGDNPEVINYLKTYLQDLGFKCDILEYEGDGGSYKVNNLHAIYNPNSAKKTLYFAGHTDVVNEGNKADWKYDPFAGDIHDGKLFGRGASDMKCALACFVSAVEEFLQTTPNPDFALGFLITNDEEAEGINGTKKVLEWMEENNYKINHCIIGEPTNPENLGQMAKVGRRGSICFKLKVIGKQGHVAYPEHALNPNTTIINILKILKDHKFDEGNEFFDATNLEITAISSQNLGNNVIPNEVSAEFNVRFNNIHNSKDIIELVEYACKKTTGGEIGKFSAKYELQYRVSGESFLSNPKILASLLDKAVMKVCDKNPELSTTGGTSDARFIVNYADEVLEFGLINQTAHKVDEFADISEIENLQKIYLELIKNYA